MKIASFLAMTTVLLPMAATKCVSVKMAVIARRNDEAIFLISIPVRLVTPVG